MWKISFFKKIIKKSFISKNSGVWCFFKSARQVCNHLYFNSKNALKTLISGGSRDSDQKVAEFELISSVSMVFQKCENRYCTNFKSCKRYLFIYVATRFEIM